MTSDAQRRNGEPRMKGFWLFARMQRGCYSKPDLRVQRLCSPLVAHIPDAAVREAQTRVQKDIEDPVGIVE
jgi:hypothetical protein